jgi:hypothetical protein
MIEIDVIAHAPLRGGGEFKIENRQPTTGHRT